MYTEVLGYYNFQGHLRLSIGKDAFAESPRPPISVSLSLITVSAFYRFRDIMTYYYPDRVYSPEYETSSKKRKENLTNEEIQEEIHIKQ